MSINAIVALALQPPSNILEVRRNARPGDLEGALDDVEGIAHGPGIAQVSSSHDRESPALFALAAPVEVGADVDAEARPMMPVPSVRAVSFGSMQKAVAETDE